jgi:glycogen(starch) synthase
LSVGRCEPRKGADVLLAAAQRLASEVRNVVYVFVGAGGWDALRTQVEQDARLRDHVLFLGPVDDRRLWELYAGADIVCVPSRYESFGLVLTEAMMFGKPIVASAVGGMPGVVEEGGNALLVPAGDGDRLAFIG